MPRRTGCTSWTCQYKFRRDELLYTYANSRGLDRLQAARKVVEFLAKSELIPHYGPQLQDWAKLARELDPRNENGYAEWFFYTDWIVQFGLAAANDPARLKEQIDRLDEWRKTFTVKDADRCALMYLQAGKLLAASKQPEQATRCFKSGLECKPTNQRVLQQLVTAATGKFVLGSGTGFVVAEGGYLLTNYHVIERDWPVVVRLAKDKDLGRRGGGPRREARHACYV